MATPVTVRAFRPDDEDAIRRICFDTALFGEPLAPLFEDVRLVSELLIGCYIRHEPDSLLVADVQGRIAGYLSGCVDTRRFLGLCTASQAARLVLDFVLRGHVFRARA